MVPVGAQWESWEKEGRRIAPQLEQNASIVVLGENTQLAAAVAVGIARAECARRHVALGDLVGDSAPLYALAGGEDAMGLADCLRDGLPLNDIARPVPECPSLFVLPAGTPPVATEFVLGHERWAKLVKGFAQAGALLVLVAPLDAPGLDSLVAATDGVVAVDTPPARVKRFPVLATIDMPEPIVSVDAAALPPSPPRRIVAAALVLLLAGGAGWVVMHRQRVSGGRTTIGVGAASPGARVAPVPVSPEPATTLPIDTVRLGAVVNPADSALASTFAVEPRWRNFRPRWPVLPPTACMIWCCSAANRQWPWSRIWPARRLSIRPAPALLTVMPTCLHCRAILRMQAVSWC